MIAKQRRWLIATLPLFAAACHDLSPTVPIPIPVNPAAIAATVCTVVVAQRSLTCTPPLPNPAPAVLGDRIVGWQDVYVKLTSTGTAYDVGTEILSSNVNFQNLAQYSMGTTDGVTTVPVRIFFEQQPTVTSGSGQVTLVGTHGAGTFTATGQPYYQYSQIVTSYEISSAVLWQFQAPATVGTFQFTVYVSAPMTDEIGTMLDRVWTGATGSDWLVGTNWRDGAAPIATSVVAIPPDSLIVGVHAQPALTANASVQHVRVGGGSSLDQGGFTLDVAGNVDAIGAITNGTTNLTSSRALIGGRLSRVTIPGAAHLQRPTVATGAVSVSGSLTVNNHPLSIQIP